MSRQLTQDQKAARAQYRREWYAANPGYQRGRHAGLSREQKDEYNERKRQRRIDRGAEFLAVSAVQCRKRRTQLAASYVATVLRMSVKDLTPELLDLKREQLTLTRLSRDLKNALKETENG